MENFLQKNEVKIRNNKQNKGNQEDLRIKNSSKKTENTKWQNCRKKYFLKNKIKNNLKCKNILSIMIL